MMNSLESSQRMMNPLESSQRMKEFKKFIIKKIIETKSLKIENILGTTIHDVEFNHIATAIYAKYEEDIKEYLYTLSELAGIDYLVNEVLENDLFLDKITTIGKVVYKAVEYILNDIENDLKTNIEGE